MPNKDYEKLLEYAFDLVSKRRLTCYEAELRLRRKNIGADGDVVRVIERLLELEYLNDALYSSDFIKDRLKFRPRGINALKSELYKKGLAKEVIESAISNACVDETEIAKELIERKRVSLAKFPLAKRKQKLVMFLRSKGLAADTIYKAVDAVGE